VAFSAHWDHLGIGPAVDGDSIYNGAEDNASGVSDLLAVARAAAQGPAPRRSLLFVFVTAEESGLLGSAAFASDPPVPIGNLVAALNLDGGNVLGQVRDFNLLGDTKSTLGPQFAALIAGRGWRVSPDQHPERGHFYRSDHFSFARAGVPAVSIGGGNDYLAHPAGWGEQQAEDYTDHRYHQPADQYRADWDLSGAVQLSSLVLEFGRQIANAAGVPQWNRDAEFASLRPPR
jgi:Zn-dependent M28 family amino/carboxypeptidase